eukprot:UN28189
MSLYKFMCMEQGFDTEFALLWGWVPVVRCMKNTACFGVMRKEQEGVGPTYPYCLDARFLGGLRFKRAIGIRNPELDLALEELVEYTFDIAGNATSTNNNTSGENCLPNLHLKTSHKTSTRYMQLLLAERIKIHKRKTNR